MSTLQKVSRAIGVLALALPLALVMLDHWSALQYAKEHEGQLPCGLGAAAAFFVGIAFSAIASLVAVVISCMARKRSPAGQISKLEIAALALGPLWFILCSIALSMLLSMLRSH